MKVIQSHLLNRTEGFKHGFFTRSGGVSPAPFDSLNFSRKREGSEENFLKNLSLAAQTLGFDKESVVLINYDHCYNVASVGREHVGEGVYKPFTLTHCDGLCTSESGVTLMTIHADCVPLFFADPAAGVISLCHAGWKGVYCHIVSKAIDEMCARGAEVQNIVCGIGPCIEVCCFEVSPELAKQFALEFGQDVTTEQNHVDLRKCLESELNALGITKIDHFGGCTCCNPSDYFSHRRDDGKCGSMASFMYLI